MTSSQFVAFYISEINDRFTVTFTCSDQLIRHNRPTYDVVEIMVKVKENGIRAFVQNIRSIFNHECISKILNNTYQCCYLSNIITRILAVINLNDNSTICVVYNIANDKYNPMIDSIKLIFGDLSKIKQRDYKQLNEYRSLKQTKQNIVTQVIQVRSIADKNKDEICKKRKFDDDEICKKRKFVDDEICKKRKLEDEERMGVRKQEDGLLKVKLVNQLDQLANAKADVEAKIASLHS